MQFSLTTPAAERLNEAARPNAIKCLGNVASSIRLRCWPRRLAGLLRGLRGQNLTSPNRRRLVPNGYNANGEHREPENPDQNENALGYQSGPLIPSPVHAHFQ